MDFDVVSASSFDSGFNSLLGPGFAHVVVDAPIIPYNDHFRSGDSGYDADSVISEGLVIQWDLFDEDEFNEDQIREDLAEFDDVPLDQLLGLPAFANNDERFDFWADRGFFNNVGNADLDPEVNVDVDNLIGDPDVVADLLPLARDPLAQAMVIAGIGPLIFQAQNDVQVPEDDAMEF